jgi:hypothetical protein
MKRMFKGITVMLVAGGLLVQVRPAVADVGDELRDLKQQLENQQEQISNLNKLVENNTRQEGAGPARESQVLLTNKLVDQLKLKGDLRVRYERREVDKPGTDDDPARDRLRTRFRLGMVWDNKSENLEIGAGLATGGADGTSTNATWSENNFFETGDIRLDYAYAKHTLGDLTLTAGQHPNPFETSWLLWDSDLRPAGFTVHYAKGLFFGTAGGYEVYQAGDDVSMVFGGQLGIKGKMGEGKYKVAGAYYDFDSKIFDKIARPNPDYEYAIGDLYATMELPLGPVTGSIYGDVFKNFGADGPVGVAGGTIDPKDENLGWVVGLGAKIADFKASIAYAVVGTDSVIGTLKDADFGTGVNETDLKGIRLDLGYAVSKDFSVGTTIMDYQAKELTNKPDGRLYQVDLNYKF